MNTILQDITKIRFNYCHVLEVQDVFELESIIDSLYDEFIEKYELEEIKNFINTMQIYCLDESEEEEVYNFNVNDYLNSL